KIEPTLAQAKPTFHEVIDAAGVSARVYEHQDQDHGLSPAASFAAFTVAHALELEQVLAEPIVRQPVSMTFDERGRLWVVQYLQYPNPAGLKRGTVDRYSLTAYDRARR